MTLCKPSIVYFSFEAREKDLTLAVAYFTDLPYFSGFFSGLKSYGLIYISHDYLSQSKFVPLPRGRVAMCSRPASKYKSKIRFVSKHA